MKVRFNYSYLNSTNVQHEQDENQRALSEYILGLGLASEKDHAARTTLTRHNNLIFDRDRSITGLVSINRFGFSYFGSKYFFSQFLRETPGTFDRCNGNGEKLLDIEP